MAIVCYEWRLFRMNGDILVRMAIGLCEMREFVMNGDSLI